MLKQLHKHTITVEPLYNELVGPRVTISFLVTDQGSIVQYLNQQLCPRFLYMGVLIREVPLYIT